MDTVDPFQELTLPPNSAVGLKEGINVSDLASGAMFEIDMATVAKEPKDTSYKISEELLQQFDLACTLGEECDDSDEPPFTQLGRSMTDLTGDKGVLKKVVQKGIGQIVPDGAYVRVHYNGYLEYADEPYDSTRLRKQPMKIRLGNQEIIPGLEIGITTMKKSEVARFLIKPEYAFGGMGCPPRIPRSATILMEVELLSYIDNKASEEYQDMPDEKKGDMTLEGIMKVAKSEKETGNDAFELKQYGKAAKHYSKGIRVLEPAHLKDDEEEEKWKEMLIKLYLNLALTNLKQCKSPLAIINCRRVLELDSQNVKATFRLGQAHMQLSEWERSKNYLMAAVHLSPSNVEIRQELDKLNKKIQQFQLLEKDICSKMFKEYLPTVQQAIPTQSSVSLDLEMKEMFFEKLLSFTERKEQRELVLPSGTNPKEVECIVEVAKQLGLKTQLGDAKSSYSVRVTKPRPLELPEDFDY